MTLLNPTSEPSIPFLIEDNFLSRNYLDFVLSEVKRLKNGYSRDGYFNKKTIRDSFDPRYCGTQYISNKRNILYSIWDRFFWKQMEQRFLDTNDSGFIHSLYTRTGQVLLSCYGDGDYYGAHVDVDMGNIITAVLMLSFYEQPTKFEGGNLILNGKFIPFRNNRLVVFPACMPHEVTKIKLDSDKYEDCRFSLQYFISATPFKKPLVDESSSIE